MTNSHANRRSLPLVAGSLSLILATSVWAQAPQPLDPSNAGQPTAAPMRLMPPSGGIQQPRAARPAVPLPKKSGIEIDGLSAIDSESIGALSAANGGLGMDMWQGARRAEALSLIAGLPSQPAFRSLRDVQLRLLLSRALAPVAVAEDVPSLLARRAQLLLTMGHVEEARMLLSAAPIQGRPKGLDRVDATLMILKYDNARACGLARNNQANAGEDFWQRLLVYCDALDGKADQVGFGLSLLRETGGDDAAMTLLTDALLTNKTVELETIAAPKPIHFALSRAAKAPLPVDMAASDDPLVLYAAATSENLILGARIEAAERAVALGVLDAAELRRLYLQVPFEETDIANALTRADEIGGSGARALLYQAATKINIPVARGEIITSAIVIGREDDRYRATIDVFRPLMDRLPPSPEMVWFALTGVRAYLTMGDAPGVERWLALLRASAQVNDDTRLGLVRIRPLVHLLGVGERNASLQEILADWRGTLAERPELAPAAALMNGMVLALGGDLPDDAWDGLPETSGGQARLPAPALWFQFRDAVGKYKPYGQPRPTASSQVRLLLPAGQAQDAEQPMASQTTQTSPGLAKPLALTLQAMSGEPGGAALFEGVAALHKLGLEDAARQLAVEALLAAGL